MREREIERGWERASKRQTDRDKHRESQRERPTYQKRRRLAEVLNWAAKELNELNCTPLYKYVSG